MISKPFAPEQIAAAADPTNYWEMAPGGLLHPDQDVFLSQVMEDPRSLGFEGSPEDTARLQVAAAYLREEQQAAMLERTYQADNEWPDYAAVAPEVIAPSEVRLIRETRQTLMQHGSTGFILQARQERAENGRPFDPIREARYWIAGRTGFNEDTLSYRAMHRIVTGYESRMYQPVVARLRNRMAVITPEHATREVAAGLLDSGKVMGMMSDDEAHLFTGTLLRAAQAAFRRTGAAALSPAELAAHMGFEQYDGAVVHELAMLGAVRRSPDGAQLRPGDMLRVQQSRLGRIAFRIGERLLHHTYLRRIPEVRAA
jgi:hypothetical protein